MKRYKLLKDLPTFKAGDEFVLRNNGCLYLNKVDAVNGYLTGVGHWKNDVMAYHKRTLEQFPNILTDWFEEVLDRNSGWKPGKYDTYWFIASEGDILSDINEGFEDIDAMASIGNCFKTKEEAELAVRKLKAWKRLKDRGFRFNGRYKPNYGEKFVVECRLPKKTLVVDVAKDLDLLFSQEDD